MTQTIESLQARVAELEAENANLLAANRDCIEHFNAMQQDLAAAQLQIKTLRDALETTHELYINASQGYGFARPNNPHNFFPDIDCCTPEEIAAHSKACSDYDSGNAISPDSWGIGTYCDEFDGAVKALSQPTSIKALDAYVAEKVKDVLCENELLENKVLARDAELWGRTQKVLELTRQRDLAVEWLERCAVHVRPTATIFYEEIMEALSQPTSTEALDAYVAEKVTRPNFRQMREMLRAMQAGELTVSRGIEILDIWHAGNWNDDMLPPVRQDLIEEDSMPVEIIDRLTRQRDLAVEALKIAAPYVKAWPQCRGSELSIVEYAIKESEGK